MRRSTQELVAALVGVAAIAFAVGGAVGSATAPQPKPVVTIPEDYDVPFNVPSGSRLDVVMYPEGYATTIVTKCDDMGGELTYSPITLIWVCEDVDH